MDGRPRGRSVRIVAVAVVVLATTTSGALVTSLPAAGQLPPGGTFTDDDGNTHEAMIEAIAAAGITLGCNPEGTLYCPHDPVRRDQMASFIARGFELPATTEDFFPDDEGNTHEDNVNRLAAAGITVGLEDGTYDPTGLVTRAQMGSFLARAMELDPIGGNRFDDVGAPHEGNINAIAEAGVTKGCNEAGTLYCPHDPVRRDQMASFIGRALGLEPIEPPPGGTTTTTTTTPQSSDCTNGTTISEGDLQTFGEYFVHNNNWNDNYGGDHTIVACAADNWYALVNVPNHDDNAVEAYMNVHKDYDDEPLANINSATFAAQGPHCDGCIWNIAFDIWLGEGLTHELMIWTENWGQRPAGSEIDTFTAGGHTYEVWRSGDDDGGIITYLSTTTQTSGTMPLSAFFDDVQERGWDPTTTWQVDYGVETVDTNGTTQRFDFTGFSIND
ncbi:MAG TPA: S-layer homology domain-containing protein [Acidimicrobiia bacterium]|nr:S-layer homology domain-containing protein [Acidimicrobiia bacterium]